jgi:hypothetical protein
MASTVKDDNFLSNLHKNDRETLLKAAKITGVRIYFEDKGTDYYGMPLKDTVGVYSADLAQDHKELWIQFNRLMQKNRNPMFRRM